MQDSARRSQHQLRCEKSNPQVQDPSCGHKQICQQVHNILILQPTYVHDLPIFKHTYVHVLPFFSLCTPSETRVSETSQLLPFTPFLPLSHPPTTNYYTQPITSHPLPYQPKTYIQNPTTYAYSSCIHHHRLWIFLNHNITTQLTSHHLPYPNITTTIQRMI
jgi:hypothetical protein